MGGIKNICVFTTVTSNQTNMNDQFSILVSRILAGEASEEDKKLLKQFLQESSEHSLMYNQLKEYWNADVHLKNSTSRDQFEARLLAELNLGKEVRPTGFRKLYIRMASAAAVIFFVMTCTLAYLYTSAAPVHIYTYSAQSIPVEYTLEDGTKATLNKNSSITFQSDYGEKSREVQLKGEAFFKVTRDKTKPFSVEALGTITRVLGTSFNVKSDVESGQVITTLLTGSVWFKAEGCKIILSPGQELVYNTKTNSYNSSSTDVQYNTAWVSGRYNYPNVSFATLAEKLEHIYKLKILITDQKIANRNVSASFLNDEPIEEILKALKPNLGFSYLRNDTTIIISKN